MQRDKIAKLAAARIDRTNYKPIAKIYYNSVGDCCCLEPNEWHIIAFGTNSVMFINTDTQKVDCFVTYDNIISIEFDDETSM